jgi:transcription elongation factor
MARNNRSNIDSELEELQQELAALTVRVAAIRNRSNTNRANIRQRSPQIGDRVRFTVAGYQGHSEGTVVGITAHRIRIQEDGRNHIYLRAPHNVRII